jgi:hypothetical protein
MVLAVRRGSPLRKVARRFGVSHGTVQHWVRRAYGQRLDRMDFTDRPCGLFSAVNRIGRRIERLVLTLRKSLRERSPLGEHGAAAIRRVLLARKIRLVPCVRTIGRILQRHGVLDARRRIRRPPPPKGWYLPLVASRQVEIDSFDTITDLVIKGGQDVTVLTGISLHGGLPASWPEARITAKIVCQRLLDHWRIYGLPAYAKFDNDTVFQGAHQWPDSFGRVTRLCLQLGVTPVFVPPREPGFQAEVESFNGRWQRFVWRRFVHRSLTDLRRRSDRFLDAVRCQGAQRINTAPERRKLPANFQPDYQRPLRDTVIFLRRTDPAGRVACLGHHWLVDRDWPHRLVRVEVKLTAGQVRCFALRRRDPAAQPLLKTLVYQPPKHPFAE